jgi:citrate/tricarballylate utilization protein
MSELQALIDEARALGSGGVPRPGPAESEVSRVMEICNACRYCEGFCAVFPAMTRRLEFAAADVHYLANLCHNCGACLHACQYAPPHEFGVNVPQAMARVRVRTYAAHAWPAAFGRAYAHNGLVVALALAFGLSLFLVLALVRHGTWWGAPSEGSFYAIFPHGLMVSMFLPVFAFALVALAVGVRRFWTGAPPGPVEGPALAEAAHDALRLKYLDGGHGEGCHNDDDRWTKARRRFHHLTFYGFLLCFASTSVATVYHYGFGWVAPYGWTSLPKLLGVTGGIGLIVGPAGLAWLRLRRHPAQGDPAQAPMDAGFLALLFIVSATGLLLALMRETPALPLLLCAHLGAVMAFFVTMPYGKFAHGFYRSAALLKWAVEKRLPSNLRLGTD